MKCFAISRQVSKEQQLSIFRLMNLPCLQVKGQISAEQRCQSWPSCRCGRRCLQSLCWQKHPARTWGQSAAQAACDWTCTRGRLEKDGCESEQVQMHTENAAKRKWRSYHPGSAAAAPSLTGSWHSSSSAPAWWRCGWVLGEINIMTK